MDIVFVILNYNLYKETIDCVESIVKYIDTKNFHIIIVDNASPSGVGKKLSDIYRYNENVSVILNEKNEGFARGNNRGIDEARKFFSPKYICCLNNDILFLQKDFFKQLESAYSQSNAAVIGPQIILKDGRVQHVNKKLQSIEHYKKRILQLENCEIEDGSFRAGLLKNRLLFELNSLRAKYRKERSSPIMDVILHGCCLIFTPIFFQNFAGFDNRTFLYAEEQLLFIALKKKCLHNLYYPRLKIIHLEDVATKSIAQTNKERKEFVRINSLESLRILVRELEANKDLIYSSGDICSR